MFTSSSPLETDITRYGVVGTFQSHASADVIRELAHFFEQILKTQQAQPLYGRYALRDWHLVSEPLRNLLTDNRLIETIVSATGAESLILWRSKLFEKFPGDGPVDWHQEYGYFDGEEVGGYRPSLYPLGNKSPWCWTVWIALTNVSLNDGVMEFVLGSHNLRYATRMVQLTQSGAFGYTEPGNRARSKEAIVERIRNNSLVLDVETAGALYDVNVDALSYDDLVAVVREYVDKKLGVVTEPFSLETNKTRTFPMDAGQYIIFNQRTMHKSLPAGPNAKLRLAISARYTLGTTLVYPQRLMNDPVDGSNLNISAHRCIRVHGTNFQDGNAYLEM